ncbi:hypothetical protein OG308_09225 [Nocardia salmonicida]|uniref:Apea-like HEPN domain-containing protein n=1 Tax=Nocardia salmonicida TaxID=53431 RepID=A0ABZ1NE00_9NOCA
MESGQRLDLSSASHQDENRQEEVIAGEHVSCPKVEDDEQSPIADKQQAIQFGIVLNDLSAELDFPVEMGNGWSMDRATPGEVEHIRRELHSIGRITRGTSNTDFSFLPYESRIVTGPGGSLQRDWTLPREEWRYTVVRINSNMLGEFWKLTQALRISEADIHIGGWINTTPGEKAYSTSIHHIECIHYLDVFGKGKGDTQVPDLTQAQEVVSLRWQLDEVQFPEIARALALFLQFDQIPDNFDAKLLGHFTVLESLLSHQPDPNDPVDSISKQLRRNLILLDHRMPNGQNLGLANFRDATPKQVISQLYAVRSAAAHGGDNQKPLQWINSRKPGDWGLLGTVHQFVERVTSRVLVAALKEPQLITDLKG